MWEEEEKKYIKKKRILVILIAVLGVGLVSAMLAISLTTKKADSELFEAQSSQKQAQSAAKQQNIDDIENLYQADLDALSTYLPGIVCWGDSLTSGSAGNTSYPYVLEKYIQANICDIYDFTASVPNANDYSYLDWSKYKIDIPVVNMGAGHENAYTILGRAGVMPFEVAYDFVIPAEVEKVEIYLVSNSGNKVNPLVGGDGGINDVIICGVTGTLSLESRWGNNKYYFERNEVGEEVNVPAGSIISTASESLYKNYIHIVCIGTYGGYNDVNALVAEVKLLLSRQEINKDRYLVIGTCSNCGNYINSETIDNAMRQEFGDKYINLRSYLCSDGVTDANITLTNEEKRQITNGRIPDCFESAIGEGELNGIAYRLLGKLVYDRMERLGYFDEIKDELYINDVVKNLLKDNPQYLEDILQTRLSEVGS